MMMMMSRLSVSTGSLLTRSDGPFGNHRVVRGASVIVGRGGGESSSADIFGSNIQHGGQHVLRLQTSSTCRPGSPRLAEDALIRE